MNPTDPDMRPTDRDKLAASLPQPQEEKVSDAELLDRQRTIIVNLRLEKHELREQAIAALRKATGKAFVECEDLLANAYSEAASLPVDRGAPQKSKEEKCTTSQVESQSPAQTETTGISPSSTKDRGAPDEREKFEAWANQLCDAIMHQSTTRGMVKKMIPLLAQFASQTEIKQ